MLSHYNFNLSLFTIFMVRSQRLLTYFFIHPHVTSWEPFNEFSLNLYFGGFAVI
jgi:hypothetical protein